jgi:hypothetical protein
LLFEYILFLYAAIVHEPSLLSVMWRWAIICVAFINNISATYYSKEKVWAVPYELTHGEPFQDVSIVLPFGCAALILLEKEERKKFQSTFAMVLFIHYAQDHPLYTYAFFSPRTKRVLFRQDCIFLPEIFPMREARAKGGLVSDGENLMVYRPRPMRDSPPRGSLDEDEAVFAAWTDEDPLPTYKDDVTGHNLISPDDDTLLEVEEKPEDWPSYLPSHPSFRPASSVPVSRPWGASVGNEYTMLRNLAQATDKWEAVIAMQPEAAVRRVARQRKVVPDDPKEGKTKGRRPVKERWFYEPVQPSEVPVLVNSTTTKGVLSSLKKITGY